MKRFPLHHGVLAFFLVAAQCLSLSARAQDEKVIPSQKDFAVQGIKHYLRTWPEFRIENLLHFSGGDDFAFFKMLHDENPEKSPFWIFGAQAGKRRPSLGWSLAFENTDQDFEEIMKRDYGWCAGFASTHRNFNMLAFFDSKNKRGQAVPDRRVDEDAWFSFMKDKIDGIMDHRIQVIPGFKDLRQFSTDPKIAGYLKETIVQEWRRMSVTFGQGYLQGLGGTKRKMSVLEMDQLRVKLQEKIALGYNPLVYAQKAKSTEKIAEEEQNALAKTWIHVLQVTDVSKVKTDGGFSIVVWDLNYKDPSWARQKIDFTANGEIFYGDHKLTNVSHLLWDDLEVADMIRKNLDYCVEHPGMCTGDEEKVVETSARCNGLLGGV